MVCTILQMVFNVSTPWYVLTLLFGLLINKIEDKVKVMSRLTEYERGWRDCHKVLKKILRDATREINSYSKVRVAESPELRSHGSTQRQKAKNNGSQPSASV